MITHTDLKSVKLCIDHIGGKLGTMLMEAFVENGWIAKTYAGDKHFHITDIGQQELTKLGVDVTKLKRKEWEYDRTLC